MKSWRYHFGVLALLLRFASSATLVLAQQSGERSVSPVQSAFEIFTSPDGVFQFKYSSLLLRCTEQRHEANYPGLWVPDSCQAYTPVCDEPGIQDGATLVCVAYSKAKFKDYPTFNAATFSVAEVKRAVTEKECLSGSSDWGLGPGVRGKPVNINHVKFKLFEINDAGIGHSLNGHIYRTFHGNQCYQLSIRIASTSSHVFDRPVKELTQKDWSEVNGRMKQALDSFRFLK